MVDKSTPGYRAVLKALNESSSPHTTSLHWSWYKTLFVLPPEVASLSRLKRITLEGSPVSDLTPISGLINLEQLKISGSQVSDLTPLANMTRLQDAAVAGAELHNFNMGLSFENTPAAKKPPYDRLASMDQPVRTVETINAIRSEVGLPPYFPKGYDPSEKGKANSEEGHDHFGQRPASHDFALRSGRIEAHAQTFSPRYPEIAEDIRSEVGAKAAEALARLENCNAPVRLTTTMQRLILSLGASLDDARPGILQMRFRSLEADAAAYDTEDGRMEVPEEAFAMLRDLMSSIEDLLGCFPELADIEAERLAQRIKDVDVPQIIKGLMEIRRAAELSDVVAPSAVEALKAGEPELVHDAEIIESFAVSSVRGAAINARDRTVGYMLLAYRNFVASVVNVGSELSGLGADTWKDIRKKAPSRVSDAAISSAIAVLVGSLLGPTAALGAFAMSFRPIHDRAKHVANRLAKVAKRKAVTKDVDIASD